MERIKNILLSVLLLHTSCHSSKNVANTVTVDTNTIATSDIRISASKLDSAFSYMTIQLDSFVFDAEPVMLTSCHGEDTARSDMVAYRYQIKASSASVKSKKTAVSRADADTLQQDSIITALSYSSGYSERSDATGVYKPPEIAQMLLWLLLAIVALLAIRIHSNNF